MRLEQTFVVGRRPKIVLARQMARFHRNLRRDVEAR
jgi:hypothetical protein